MSVKFSGRVGLLHRNPQFLAITLTRLTLLYYSPKESPRCSFRTWPRDHSYGSVWWIWKALFPGDLSDAQTVAQTNVTRCLPVLAGLFCTLYAFLHVIDLWSANACRSNRRFHWHNLFRWT